MTSGRGSLVAIMTTPPDKSGLKWSEAQQRQRKRFKLAAAYAKAAMADPKVRLIYEKKAAKAHKSPWNLARSDYFKGKDLLTKK